MRIFWLCGALTGGAVGCAPERVADDPVTQAGIAAARRPPATGPLAVTPGVGPQTSRFTVIRARLTSGAGVEGSIRALRTAVADDVGSERLDTWGLTEAPTAVEDGRTCLVIGDAFYSGWRTRPLQRLRAATHPTHCVDADPLAELVERFADEITVIAQGRRVDFRLHARDRLPPDPIPLTWPEGTDRQRLGAPRALYLQSHARPRAFAGHLTRDAAGRLESGRLDARFAVRKDGRDAELAVEIRVWRGGFTGRLVAPSDAGVETPRERIVPRIEAVLGTLPADSTPLPGPGDAPPLKLPEDPDATP